MLDAEEIAKNAMIKTLTDKVPEAIPYSYLLYFIKEGTKLTMKTDKLPAELIEKISKMF